MLCCVLDFSPQTQLREASLEQCGHCLRVEEIVNLVDQPHREARVNETRVRERGRERISLNWTAFLSLPRRW